MAAWSPHLYRAAAHAVGLDKATIKIALTYVQSLARNQIPPILTLRHLARHVEVGYGTLRELVERRCENPYRLFFIRKRLGGYRRICVPCPPLMRIQRWLNRYVLRPQSVHPNSYAFHATGGIVRCAQRHCGAKWLIKIDLRQFFESITERSVFRVFAALGFPRLLAFEMTRLCTRDPEWPPERRVAARWLPNRRTYDFYWSRKGILGSLPQGAPTSPMLSNLCCFRLDAQLDVFARERGLTVTRYADDIIFSTADDSFIRGQATEVVAAVQTLLFGYGFQMNPLKVSITPPGARKIVLGLQVEGDRPRLPGHFKGKLEAHLYGLEKFGIDAHCAYRRFDSPYGLRRHLDGMIAFAVQVDPPYGHIFRKRLNSLPWHGGTPASESFDTDK